MIAYLDGWRRWATCIRALTRGAPAVVTVVYLGQQFLPASWEVSEVVALPARFRAMEASRIKIVSKSTT